MARIKNSVILCLSLFISIIFYYLEMVHEYFFKIYSHALNKIPVFECNAWISLVFLFYFILFYCFDWSVNFLEKNSSYQKGSFLCVHYYSICNLPYCMVFN